MATLAKRDFTGDEIAQSVWNMLVDEAIEKGFISSEEREDEDLLCISVSVNAIV